MHSGKCLSSFEDDLRAAHQALSPPLISLCKSSAKSEEFVCAKPQESNCESVAAHVYVRARMQCTRRGPRSSSRKVKSRILSSSEECLSWLGGIGARSQLTFLFDPAPPGESDTRQMQ